jgi:hypothetical protein
VKIRYKERKIRGFHGHMLQKFENRNSRLHTAMAMAPSSFAYIVESIVYCTTGKKCKSKYTVARLLCSLDLKATWYLSTKPATRNLPLRGTGYIWAYRKFLRRTGIKRTYKMEAPKATMLRSKGIAGFIIRQPWQISVFR